MKYTPNQSKTRNMDPENCPNMTRGGNIIKTHRRVTRVLSKTMFKKVNDVFLQIFSRYVCIVFICICIHIPAEYLSESVNQIFFSPFRQGQETEIKSYHLFHTKPSDRNLMT